MYYAEMLELVVFFFFQVTYSLVIGQCFHNLVPLNCLAFDTGLVLPHSRNHQHPLVSRKATERHWRVWKVEGETDGPEGTDSTNDEELIAPCGERTLNLT